MIGLLVLVTLCVAGRYLPGGPLPLVIGAAAIFALVLLRGMVGPRTDAYGIAVVVTAALAGVTWFYPSTRLLSALLCCVATGLLAPFISTLVRHVTRRDARGAALPPLTVFHRVATIVVGVCLGLFVLSQFATYTRQQGAYYRQRGVAVHVDTSAARCGEVQKRRNGVVVGLTSIFCDDATWQATGATVSGTVYSTNLSAFNKGDHDVPAFAIGNSAYAAKGLVGGDPLVPLGQLPPAPLEAPIGVALVVLIARALWRRRLSRPAAG